MVAFMTTTPVVRPARELGDGEHGIQRVADVDGLEEARGLFEEGDERIADHVREDPGAGGAPARRRGARARGGRGDRGPDSRRGRSGSGGCRRMRAGRRRRAPRSWCATECRNARRRRGRRSTAAPRGDGSPARSPGSAMAVLPGYDVGRLPRSSYSMLSGVIAAGPRPVKPFKKVTEGWIIAPSPR